MNHTIHSTILAATLTFVAVRAEVSWAAVITDNFTAPGNWEKPVLFSKGSNLIIANGRVNYTCSAAEGGGAMARKTPLLPTTRDWSLKVDVHLDPFAITSDDQWVDVFLGFGKTGDWVDTHVIFEFARGYWHSGFFDIGDDVRIDGKDAPGLFNVNDLTSPDAALRLDYNALNQTVTYWFDENGAAGGYNWVAQGTANLASGVYDLKMRPADTFSVLLVGSSENQTVAAGQAYLANLEITVAGPEEPSGPSGDYERTVTDRLNAVWDLSSVAALTSGYSFVIEDKHARAQFRFARPFQQSGSGRLAGGGDTRVYIESVDEEGPDAYDFAAIHKTTGTVIGNKGLCKILLNTTANGTAFLKGANRNLTVMDTVSIILDKESLMTSGTRKARAFQAKGGVPIQSTASWTQEPAGLGEGHWTLRLLDLVTTGKTTSGAAEVVLHSGAAHPFTVKGVYNTKTRQTKLVLLGQGTAAGANLTVTMSAENAITSIKGKLFGQMVNAAF
jgi:hypothetical protein